MRMDQSKHSMERNGINIMNLEHEPYQPTIHENFWCNRCDKNTVDSMNEDSGRFFLFSGHGFNARSKSYNGSYEMVMHAICSTCLKETNSS